MKKVAKSLNLSLEESLNLGLIEQCVDIYYLLSIVFNELKELIKREKAAKYFHIGQKMLYHFKTNKKCSTIRMSYK